MKHVEIFTEEQGRHVFALSGLSWSSGQELFNQPSIIVNEFPAVLELSTIVTVCDREYFEERGRTILSYTTYIQQEGTMPIPSPPAEVRTAVDEMRQKLWAQERKMEACVGQGTKTRCREGEILTAIHNERLFLCDYKTWEEYKKNHVLGRVTISYRMNLYKYYGFLIENLSDEAAAVDASKLYKTFPLIELADDKEAEATKWWSKILEQTTDAFEDEVAEAKGKQPKGTCEHNMNDVEVLVYVKCKKCGDKRMVHSCRAVEDIDFEFEADKVVW